MTSHRHRDVSPSKALSRYGAVDRRRHRRSLRALRQGVMPTLREVIAAGRLDTTRSRKPKSERSPDYAARCGELAAADSRRRKKSSASASITPTAMPNTKTARTRRNFPSMFMRTPRSFVGHLSPLVRPRASAQLDYEGEVVLVIGKAGRHIPESSALDHVAAVTLCNEGTIRDWVRHAKFNVTQGKNFDATGSLGPWLVPYTDESQIADIKADHARINGETRQDDRTGRSDLRLPLSASIISRPSPRSYQATSSSRGRRPAPAPGSIRRAT